MTAPEPRWLTHDERAAWLSLVRLMTKLPPALDAQLQREHSLTYFEYMVLAMLSERSDRTLRMSELAALISGSLSRLSHVVKRLEKRGLVRREPCPEDGRFTNAVLTDEGWLLVVTSAPGHVDLVRASVIDVLTHDQLRQLQAIGDQVLAQIDPDSVNPLVNPLVNPSVNASLNP